MPAYLSDEWLRAVDDALGHHRGLAAATANTALVIQNIVTGADPAGGSVAYAIRLDHGRCEARAGEHPDADVTFTTDHATAEAINRGDESAQTAFMAGRLRIGGDARVLIAHQGLLAGLEDVLAFARGTDADAPAEVRGA